MVLRMYNTCYLMADDGTSLPCHRYVCTPLMLDLGSVDLAVCCVCCVHAV
jgi:hypothetical protein